jgi:tetratricopeptide (TPR) repeat protein
VFRKLDDKDFEVFAAKVNAAFLRLIGRYSEAEAELSRALGIARARDLINDIVSLTTDVGRSLFDRSDYNAARERLLEALSQGSGKDTLQARIYLGRTHVRLGDFETARRDLSRALADVQESGDNGLLPLLHLALGELAFESGRAGEARESFSAASALWTDDLADPESVEARALLGLLDALDGKHDRGKMAIEASIDRAVATRQSPLEARCRLYLARVLVAESRFEEAISSIPPEIQAGDAARLGAEATAQALYWRSIALARHNRDASQTDAAAARALVSQLRASLPERFRESFTLRASVAPIVR